MKIAVTAKGAGLGAWIDPNFTTCLQVVIVDDRDRFDAWMNPYRENAQDEGLSLADKLINKKVDILVTGLISTAAKQRLTSVGIKVINIGEGSILELVEIARKQN